MSCKIPARRFRFVNPCILERTRHLCHFSTIVYSVILRKRPVLHFIFPPPVFSFIPRYVFEMPRNSLHPTALSSSPHPFICNLFTLLTGFETLLWDNSLDLEIFSFLPLLILFIHLSTTFNDKNVSYSYYFYHVIFISVYDNIKISMNRV